MKTFCEFFAGIGPVREGLSSSGWQCVYANDIDSKKQEMYQLRFGDGEHFHQGDVWDAKAVVARIPGRPMLATASFPCIDLSLAGHWRGFEGDHSSAFFGFARVLEELGERRPPLVMLENVAGFITSGAGKDFEAAVRSLAALGYWIDSFVLDAKYFVPQSRPRVFVVGVHESVNSAPVVYKSGLVWTADEWTQLVKRGPTDMRPPRLVRLMESITLPTGWAAFRLPQPTTQRGQLADLIDLDETQEWWEDDAVRKHHDMMSLRHRKRVNQLLASGGRFVGTIFRRKRRDKTRAEVRFDGLAGCLRTPRGGSARQIIIAIESGRLRHALDVGARVRPLPGRGRIPVDPKQHPESVRLWRRGVCAGHPLDRPSRTDAGLRGGKLAPAAATRWPGTCPRFVNRRLPPSALEAPRACSLNRVSLVRLGGVPSAACGLARFFRDGLRHPCRLF